MRMYDFMTFDLDGTLADTACEIVAACNATLSAIGYHTLPDQQIETYIGHGTKELMRQALRASVPKETTEQQIEFLLHDIMPSFNEFYENLSGSMALPFPGVAEALNRFQLAGIRMAVVTNKEFSFAVKVLNALGLSGFFELVIGGDTLSEKKPSARTIEFCAEHMGISLEHAAHVGDSVIDIETARNANVACIAVSFGYNGGVPIVAGKPDLIIDHFDDLANYVLDSDQTRQLIA